jgi:Ras-related protein Rab-23
MKKKYVKSLDKEIEFMIWDTAGQEYYDAITKRYYKGSSGALIVFSASDRQSFEDTKKWFNKVREECGEIPTYLIQNKIDLINECKVSDKESIEMAKNLKCTLFKTSVKDDIMVNEIFDKLAMDYFNRGNFFTFI